MRGVFVAYCVLWLAMAVSYADEAGRRKELGHGERLRVLVDKVMQPQGGWRTEEWMVRASAEAGFNVFSPRKGHEDLDAVKQVTEWCAAYGIYHMPWMRGSLDVPLENVAAAGKRMVWANGVEQALWSVNSDEFWEWTSRLIVAYAHIGAENKALMGVFLDYENYAPGGQDNLYSLSYDDTILAKFAAEAHVDIPVLSLAQRKPWLEERHLHESFADCQIRHWRERCRALRKAVDAVNPSFQFCIYPAPGTPFVTEAAYREWATEAAPIILADASTYGRPSRLLPEQESLSANHQRLIERMETPAKAGMPFIYMGGIDPVVRGADPEFSGKNAVMCAETTGGYWIFYEGPSYTKQDHRDYWKWFTWANGMIAHGQFAAQHQPRETPESYFDGLFSRLEGKTALSMPSFTAEEREFRPTKLRGENLLWVAGKSDVPVEIVLKHEPVAKYEAPVRWELDGPDRVRVASGTIGQQETGCVRFTPAKDSVYVLAVSAGTCAYSVLRSNVPVAIDAGEKASLIGPAPRLYVAVPKGIKSFAIAVDSAGQETVRVNIFDAHGAPIATGQTSPNEHTATIAVAHDENVADICSLETTKADAGVIEDYAIALDPRLVPALSFVPEHVFAPSPAQ